MTHEEAMEDDFQVPNGMLPKDQPSPPSADYWKKVEDGLPENGKEVLVWILGGSYPVQAFHNNQWWFGSREVTDWMNDVMVEDRRLFKIGDSILTHWMPLPTKPNL